MVQLAPAIMFMVMMALGLHSTSAQAADFDPYGGYTGIQGTATGFFHTQKLQNEWWLMTPEGHAFFALGVSAVHPSSDFDETGKTFKETIKTKYAAPGAMPDTFSTDWNGRWAYYVRQRLRRWGYNHASTFSHPPVTTQVSESTVTEPPMGGLPPNQLPQVITNRAGRNSMGADRPWRVKNLYGPIRHVIGGSRPYFPDVFDPNFKAAQVFAAQNSPKTYPWILYIFMDQTDEMRGVDSGHAHLGFVAMATNFAMASDSAGFGGAQTYANTMMYTKHAVRDFLQTKYSRLAALNTAWGTAYTAWGSAGGWGTGTGVLDEDGRHLGETWTRPDPGKNGFPAVRADLDAFATTLMRQWYRTVYHAFKEAGSPYMLVTNNMGTPKEYVYHGLKSADGTEVYTDFIFANDSKAGEWSDFLDRPFSAGNLGGYFTAENDSPLGYVGTVNAFTADDATKTITITCHACNFYWADHAEFKPVHHMWTRFSSLPPVITRGTSSARQQYRSTQRLGDWISATQFRVRQGSYASGTYPELRDALQVGDTFERTRSSNYAGPFASQATRGQAYAQQLRNALVERTPQGTYFRVAANLWAYKDTTWFHWEIYNFGLVTVRDNAYDGKEACFNTGVDAYGFQRQAESRPPHIAAACFGDFLTYVQEANRAVYTSRPMGNASVAVFPPIQLRTLP